MTRHPRFALQRATIAVQFLPADLPVRGETWGRNSKAKPWFFFSNEMKMCGRRGSSATKGKLEGKLEGELEGTVAWEEGSLSVSRKSRFPKGGGVSGSRFRPEGYSKGFLEKLCNFMEDKRFTRPWSVTVILVENKRARAKGKLEGEAEALFSRSSISTRQSSFIYLPADLPIGNGPEGEHWLLLIFIFLEILANVLTRSLRPRRRRRGNNRPIFLRVVPDGFDVPGNRKPAGSHDGGGVENDWNLVEPETFDGDDRFLFLFVFSYRRISFSLSPLHRRLSPVAFVRFRVSFFGLSFSLLFAFGVPSIKLVSMNINQGKVNFLFLIKTRFPRPLHFRLNFSLLSMNEISRAS